MSFFKNLKVKEVKEMLETENLNQKRSNSKNPKSLEVQRLKCTFPIGSGLRFGACFRLFFGLYA